MRHLTSIVAVNCEGAIGAGNALPWRVRSDLRFFREQTLDHVVIMGRKTFDSLGQKGLPSRQNIVVTHNFAMHPKQPDCWTVGSIDEALFLADKLSLKKKDVFVVGGASMYEQFAPFVQRYLITEVDKSVPNADTFFSREYVGRLADWKVIIRAEGVADGVHDEANYRIFELVALDPLAAMQRRSKVIDGVVRRRSGNRLAEVPFRMVATG